MTLRRLLSHTAGAADVGPVGIPASEYPLAIPPLWQRLLGLDCNANGCFFDKVNVAWYDPALGPPGTQSKYGNGGLFLAQAMLEQAAGNVPFHQLVKQYVLDPLGMENSRIVVQPQSAAWEEGAAQMHDQNGTPREREIYIWSGSGGLYASAGDYARAMIPLMNGGKTQEGNDYLHPFSVFLMLQTVPPNTSYSLGLNLDQAIVTPQGGTFSHNGSHPNRARSNMMGRPDRKQGFVVLVNGGGVGPATLISELNEAFKQVYGW
jgi:CubicO group peptidase (beta-lactamase class C family)